ncbi:TauD/TfdA family dioxygenase [Kitasatospora sp. NPDC059795]|uniref:TauD/TfdA family dioxygenase n=1 Tax=Kitasatospora sp. NPDC059795 TaxID=3346949 RepID=UPI00364843CE
MTTPQLLPAPMFLDGPTAPRAFAEHITGVGHGRALIAFDPADHRLNQELALGLLSALGPVPAVYPADGCWSALEVRTEVDPGRTHGTGENRLHVDLVDRDLIPRYIALYCERDDPAGGGASALADLWAAAAELGDADRSLLQQPVFSYWTDQGVHGVGGPLERFAVLPEQLEPGLPIRFTTKMHPHLLRGQLVAGTAAARQETASAFGALVDAALRHRIELRLRPGQLLVFDQLRWAHGRMPLGGGQDAIAPDLRRRLRQAYVQGGAR